MPNFSISKSLLLKLQSAAQKIYPNEFICLISTTKESPSLLSEWVVLPAEFGKTHSQIRLDLLPFDSHVRGIVHSHPSPNMQASSADLNVFARFGQIHLILGYPYSLSDYRAYTSNGALVELPIQE